MFFLYLFFNDGIDFSVYFHKLLHTILKFFNLFKKNPLTVEHNSVVQIIMAQNKKIVLPKQLKLHVFFQIILLKLENKISIRESNLGQLGNPS